MLSLFQEYPLLGEKLPYLTLGELPTPVDELRYLGSELGVGQLYIKRDDLSGQAYGGNKVRKLEFLLAGAVRSGAKEVMTFGAAGSNHALATAIYAHWAGLGSISMLRPQPNAKYVRKNLLLSHFIGAELHYYTDEESLRRGVQDQQRIHTQQKGVSPVTIPMGGTSPLGAAGFVSAGFELRDQIRAGMLPEPDRLYVALGSMGTAVGLLLGLRAAGLRTQLHAVRVVYDGIANPDAVRELFEETNRFLHSADPEFPLFDFPEEQFVIRDEFYGEQYALFTPDGMAAVRRMRDLEDIFLDGTYTGKTLSALIHNAERGELRKSVVLFWNTLNSRDFSPVIRDIDYHELPKNLYRYFEDEVQPLDR